VIFVFVAVNYNGSEHTENYLSSLDKIKIPLGDKIRAIIVDNSSAVDDLKLVIESVERRDFAELIALKENRGYFAGINAGLKAYAKSEDIIFVVGNNDLMFDPNFIEAFKLIPKDPSNLVIAPNVITLDGRYQNPHVLTKVPWIELVKARIYFSNYYIAVISSLTNGLLRKLLKLLFGSTKYNSSSTTYEQRVRIKRGIGACYVLSPSFFHYYEKLDDRVFLWGEEALLSHQVERVGGYTLYEPGMKVTHCESASVRFIERRQRYEMVKRSYRIYRKYL
jgi:GT2 family glycosyltransferase